jgi:plasmid stability protein
MACLNLELPDDLYEALQTRAEKNGSSMAAEVIVLLERFVPTKLELQRRQNTCDHLAELRAKSPFASGPLPAAEDMVREDRER